MVPAGESAFLLPQRGQVTAWSESAFLLPQRTQVRAWGEEVEREEPHRWAALVASVPPAPSAPPYTAHIGRSDPLAP